MVVSTNLAIIKSCSKWNRLSYDIVLDFVKESIIPKIFKMVSNKCVSLFVMVAVIAFVTAVPAPQFQQPRQIVPGPQQQKNINPEAEQLEGSSDDKDLKGSASYGYGYYGGLGYGGLGYGGGYGYPYGGYGYSSYGGYGYPSYGYGYYGNSYPYYRGFGGLYGGYYY